MWGEIFKIGLSILGKNLSGSGDNQGPVDSGFDPVSFDKFEMEMFKPEGASTVQQPEVSNYIAYRNFWDDRLTEYEQLARKIASISKTG